MQKARAGEFHFDRRKYSKQKPRAAATFLTSEKEQDPDGINGRTRHLSLDSINICYTLLKGKGFKYLKLIK